MDNLFLDEIIFSETKTSTDTFTDIIEQATHKIVIYNDDVNTFEWVIESLIELCKHSAIQAEQCTLLIHHKGKASVKEGLKKDLLPIQTALIERGLTAVIE